MDRESVHKLFDIRDRAHALLKWLDRKAAEGASVLSDEVIAALRSPDSCAEWVAENGSRLPGDAQPLTRGPKELGRFAQCIANLLAVSLDVSETVHDGRIEKKKRRQIVPRAPQRGLQPEARLAMKAYVRQLAQSEGLTLARADVDEIVDDLRWPLRGPLVYCAFVDAAICGGDIRDRLGAARALWSELPARARFTLNAHDYLQHLDALRRHLRVAYRPKRDEPLIDARD